MISELAALVEWLRSSGRMQDVHYARLLCEVTHVGERALFMVNSQDDLETLATVASAIRTVEAHLEAAVVDHDPAALASLLDGLIPLARFVGDNPVQLLVATGVLTDEDVDDWGAEAARRNPPPPA